jgi:hypothetical protein
MVRSRVCDLGIVLKVSSGPWPWTNGELGPCKMVVVVEGKGWW